MRVVFDYLRLTTLGLMARRLSGLAFLGVEMASISLFAHSGGAWGQPLNYQL
jgi:hypothetical protein